MSYQATQSELPEAFITLHRMNDQFTPVHIWVFPDGYCEQYDTAPVGFNSITQAVEYAQEWAFIEGIPFM